MRYGFDPNVQKWRKYPESTMWRVAVDGSTQHVSLVWRNTKRKYLVISFTQQNLLQLKGPWSKYVETVLITFLNVKALGRKYTHSSYLKEDRTCCFWVLKIGWTLPLKERHKFN